MYDVAKKLGLTNIFSLANLLKNIKCYVTSAVFVSQARLTSMYNELSLFCAVQQKENAMLKNQYFQAKDLNPLMGSLEKPFKDLMELNVKTLQGMSYLTPLELMNVKKPEEILEKNVDVIIENGHKTLDYMHNMFNLLEQNWLHLSDNLGKTGKDMMEKTEHMARSSVNKAVHSGQQAVKQASEHSKDTLKKAQSVTKDFANKVTGTSKATKTKTKAAHAAVKNRDTVKNEMNKAPTDRLQ